jgi:hypothetical protein
VRFPNKVKIGGITYGIEITENISLGADYNGEWDYRKQVIKIRPMGLGVMERTLVHEIMHGIFYNLGYVSPGEDKVDEMAGALYALIIDNPDMFNNKK